MEKVGKGTGTPLYPLLISVLVFSIPIHNRVFEWSHTKHHGHTLNWLLCAWLGANSAPVTFHCTAPVPSHCSWSTPLVVDLWFFLYSFRWVCWNFHSPLFCYRIASYFKDKYSLINLGVIFTVLAIISSIVYNNIVLCLIPFMSLALNNDLKEWNCKSKKIKSVSFVVMAG